MNKYRIVLPEKGPKPTYYQNYVGYIKKILEYNGIPFSLDGCINVGEVQYPTATKFLMRINDKRGVIDFSDNIPQMPSWSNFDAYFKFHYVRKVHEGCKTIYPFAPVSFYDWRQYEQLRNEINYTCNNDLVLNMQRPGGNALERRNKVQKLLVENYGNRAVIRYNMSQIDYWKMINDCLVHVFVPGCRNDMIDRGHLQYFAFGCCTIAPRINDELPHDGVILPDYHYIRCASDYSDLIDKIEWCRSHRKECIEIGNRAKQLFEKSCTPIQLWNWILEKLWPLGK